MLFTLLPPTNSFLEDYVTVTETDDCIGVVCQHGGACQDGHNTYTCHCQAGYSGVHCESKTIIMFEGLSSLNKVLRAGLKTFKSRAA